MAKAPEKQEEAAAEAPAQKPKKKLVIILVAALVALVALSGAGAYFWKKSQSADAEEGQGEHGKKKGKSDAPPVIVKLDQFTVKLLQEESKPDQYMQTVIELELLDAHGSDQIRGLMSKIRAKILLLLMGKTPTELSTPQGVENLTAEIRNQINQILDGKARPPGTLKAGPDDPVQAVYLTQFIVQ